MNNTEAKKDVFSLKSYSINPKQSCKKISNMMIGENSFTAGSRPKKYKKENSHCVPNGCTDQTYSFTSYCQKPFCNNLNGTVKCVLNPS